MVGFSEVASLIRDIEKRVVETGLGRKHTYFYDAGKNAEYRRVVGGVAWPVANSLGFVCVLAEDDHAHPRLKTRICRVLDEFESLDVDRIIKRLYDFQNRYLLTPWYGDCSNNMMGYLVDQFNRNLGLRKKAIYVEEAPFADDAHNLQLYANQIKARTMANKKSLFFGPDSKLPAALTGLTPDAVQTKAAQLFPPVAALGFALGGLDEPYAEGSHDQELHDRYRSRMAVEGL